MPSAVATQEFPAEEEPWQGLFTPAEQISKHGRRMEGIARDLEDHKRQFANLPGVVQELRREVDTLTQQVGELNRDGEDRTQLIGDLREEVEGLKEQLGRQDDGGESDGLPDAAVDARLERLEDFAKLSGTL